MRYLILDGTDPDACEIRVSDLGICLHLNKVVAKIKGGARKTLHRICQNADILGVPLSLNACPVRTELYPDLLADERLVKWYEEFGFKRHVSDFHYFYFMSNVMLRRPDARIS